MNGTYLDWAATAKPWQDLSAESAALAVRSFGNPSSAHGPGREARESLEASRARLGLSLACPASAIVFTSGGSEADSIVMLSALLRGADRSAVVSAIEHSAVFEQAAAMERLGVRVLRVAPRPDGTLDPRAVADAVRPDTVLVSVMAVNNETGAIQDLAGIAALCREASRGRALLIHSDAVQAFGKIPFKPVALGLDAASMSAHKLGGPRGVGALWLRAPIQVLARGGGQENGLRPGTHNVAGAWAFSMAAARASDSMTEALSRARALEARLLQGAASIPGCLPLPQARAAGDGRYSPYIVPLAFPGLGAETMVRLLDDAGVFVSAGAACSAHSKERRVYDAMGTPRELSFSAVRVSFGRESSPGDVDRFLEAAASLYARYKT